MAAFYRFAALSPDDLQALRQQLLTVGHAGDVRGSVLLAPEGVNGTVSGPPQGVEALLAQLRQDPRLAALEVKTSTAPHQTFHRFKVRLKREIVTMGCPTVRPYLDESSRVGTHVPPQQWDALIRDPATLVIDTRNHYEVELGTFAGAVDPGTDCFREFPVWVAEQLPALIAERGAQRLALFCTGGIRCEKATAYLKQQGYGGVHHLQGGILRYLETTPEQDSSWRGECYVFDQRVSVNHQLQPGSYSLCHACGLPLSPQDRALPSYQEGVSCRHCLERFTEADRRRFAERQRQMALARQRGLDHLGPGQGGVSPGLALADGAGAAEAD